MTVEEHLRLMKTLDDAWSAQDWDTFRARHAPDVVVSWPGGAAPTRGIAAHEAESRAFFTTFPDNHLDNAPYTIQFGRGDWTCSAARFTGHMGGPMTAPDGTVLPPTNKPFEIDFSTVARWSDGEIVEERLIYDPVGFMKQIGLG
jgi:ketosteroid isomerase-like protein